MPVAKDYASHERVELMPLTPAAMRQYQIDEIARFSKIAKEAGLQPR